MKLELLSGEKNEMQAFGIVSLGIIEALASGAINPTESIRIFFNSDNCLYVHEELKNETAENIMGRGVQLADLFDILEPQKALLAFLHEIDTMRVLCHSLITPNRECNER
jgi:hypothetical protein